MRTKKAITQMMALEIPALASCCLENSVRFDACRADPKPLHTPADHSTDILKIWQPPPPCPVMGMADIIPADRFFPTNITCSCHRFFLNEFFDTLNIQKMINPCKHDPYVVETTRGPLSSVFHSRHKIVGTVLCGMSDFFSTH
jgi:hypothetical protein